MRVPGFCSSAIISAMESRSASSGSEGTLFFSSLMLWMICSAPCRVVGRNTGTGTWRGQDTQPFGYQSDNFRFLVFNFAWVRFVLLNIIHHTFFRTIICTVNYSHFKMYYSNRNNIIIIIIIIIVIIIIIIDLSMFTPLQTL